MFDRIAIIVILISLAACGPDGFDTVDGTHIGDDTGLAPAVAWGDAEEYGGDEGGDAGGEAGEPVPDLPNGSARPACCVCVAADAWICFDWSDVGGPETCEGNTYFAECDATFDPGGQANSPAECPVQCS